MTLIEVYAGGSRRRCDARCYNGHSKQCKCVCGGRNHGKGLQRALDNTRKIAEEIIEQVEKEGGNVKIAKQILQQEFKELGQKVVAR